MKKILPFIFSILLISPARAVVPPSDTLDTEEHISSEELQPLHKQLKELLQKLDEDQKKLRTIIENLEKENLSQQKKEK